MTIPLLQELSAELGIGFTDLLRIISSGPARYKVYQIPKRRGGMRTIAQPSRDLKFVQRYLLDNKLGIFSVHPNALGYVKGKNIADNAKIHKDSRIILKLDFINFFPSLKVEDWEIIARNKWIIDVDIYLYNRILFWGNGSYEPKCLSIGAPTSQMLSNIIMYETDKVLSAAALRMKVIYTRYADDITASSYSRQSLMEFEGFTRRYLDDMVSPRLNINDAKRGMFGPSLKRMVIGLVITPTANISIGRERKRRISAMLHKVTLGGLEAKSMLELRGLLSFAKSVEPRFIASMRKKYGNETLIMVFATKVGPVARP
jgi:RNA-directed DNA polymerase